MSDVEFGLSEPTYYAINPTAAPADLLEYNRIDEVARAIRSSSLVGPVAVRLEAKAQDGNYEPVHFFAPLQPDSALVGSSRSSALQRYPYAILPDRTEYGITAFWHSSAETGWSDSQAGYIGPATEVFGEGGFQEDVLNEHLSRQDFAKLQTGERQVAILQQSRQTLAIAARIENGEPLIRRKIIRDDGSVSYQEAKSYPSATDGNPQAKSLPIRERITQHDGNKIHRQTLEFRAHRVDEVGQANEVNPTDGLVEVLFVQSDMVRYTGVVVDPPPGLAMAKSVPGATDLFLPDRNHQREQRETRSVVPAGNLIGGQTHYRSPQAARLGAGSAKGKNKNTYIVKNHRPVAAVRFLLVSALS